MSMLEELKRQQDEANNKKAMIGAIGAVADGFTRVPTMADLMLNRKTENRAGDTVRSASAFVVDPMEQKQKEFGAAKSIREMQAFDDQDKLKAIRKDPNSGESKALKGLYKGWGLEVADTDTAQDLISRYGDPSELSKARLTSQWDFEKQKALRSSEQAFNERQKRLDREADLQKIAMQFNSPSKQFDNMAEDKKLTITELAKKNASKTSIVNQIKGTMQSWDDLSDDQKLAKGRQLLKTLNSTEGADAIGAEEANRLGAKLEFAMGNLFSSNSTQFGRDLKGFKTQVDETVTGIENAIAENQKIIDQNYGRAPVTQVAAQPKQSESEALKWAMDNPRDPRSAKILDKLNINKKAVGQR